VARRFVSLRIHSAQALLGHGRDRRLHAPYRGFGIEAGSLDGISVCRMFGHAISGKPLPKRVSTDHDPLFRVHCWLTNLRVLEIEKITSIPYAPASVGRIHGSG
jgi:hypothetical protein